MRWPLGFQKAPQDQDSLTGELDSPGLDCGYQPDHAHQVVCREAKEEGGDPGGLGLWAAGHDQGSRALTHTDSRSGRQAADGAENPSWQQSCISTFFFFLPTQLCPCRFKISAAAHLGATCQDCKSLSVLALGSNP